MKHDSLGHYYYTVTVDAKYDDPNTKKKDIEKKLAEISDGLSKLGLDIHKITISREYAIKGEDY